MCLCKTCGTICPFDDERTECDAYAPMTNENWFISLPTEEKAKVLRRRTYGNSEDNETVEQGWVNWLKAKHEDNPPDIPSVPSWDKWLEGERTKCTYCDGTNAECNLVGRFECPKTPKTEQEYIQNCDTEQLAEWIARRVNESVESALYDDYLHDGKIDWRDYMVSPDDIVEWLKKTHAEKE